MAEGTKLATIECATCGTLIEVFSKPGEPGIDWGPLGDNICAEPPLRRCRHAREEVRRRFPEFDI